MSPTNADGELVDELVGLHDVLQTQPGLVQETVRWAWDEHPWSGGAYAFYSPGDQSALNAALLEPEGRLLLAGEHASFTHSWIQGAIDSGLRAALQIAMAD